jgi:hypothetical protein
MVKVAVWWKKKVLWSSLLYPVAKIEVLERMVWMRCGWEGGGGERGGRRRRDAGVLPQQGRRAAGRTASSVRDATSSCAGIRRLGLAGW